MEKQRWVVQPSPCGLRGREPLVLATEDPWVCETWSDPHILTRELHEIFGGVFLL